jgi:hypothetical protein
MSPACPLSVPAGIQRTRIEDQQTGIDPGFNALVALNPGPIVRYEDELQAAGNSSLESSAFFSRDSTVWDKDSA